MPRLLYQFVRPLARLALKAGYRHIDFAGAEQIPANGPVLFAVNHPTAFVEPCLMATMQPRSLHFIVRGDVFKKQWAANILRQFQMIPVYRLKDGGYEQLKNNYQSIEESTRVLMDQEAIMILAEGTTIHEKRLRPLRKGTARIAFNTWNDAPDLDVTIIPVGVNYTYAEKLRQEVYIKCGAPIALSAYRAIWQEAPLQAQQQLLDDLTVAMRQLVIHIEDPGDESMMEQLFQLYRNTHPLPVFPVQRPTDERLEVEFRLAEWVNKMPRDEKAAWRRRLNAYFDQLKAWGVRDQGMAQKVQELPLSTFKVLSGLPLAALGAVLNGLPWLITHAILERQLHPTRDIEYRSSVGISVAMVLYLLYYALAALFYLFQGQYWGILWVLLWPALGFFSVNWLEHWKAWWEYLQVLRIDRFTRRQLVLHRQELTDQLRNIWLGS